MHAYLRSGRSVARRLTQRHESIQPSVSLRFAFLNAASSSRRFSTVDDIAMVELPLPALSPTMETGVISSWKKQVGDFVEAGDVIADIQTDKAVVDFECQDEGYLAAILIPEGEEHPVGVPVAIMVEEKEDIEKAQKLASQVQKPRAETVAPVADTPAPSAAPAQANYETLDVKPLLPAPGILMERHNIDPSSVKPSGPKGHILKGDVLEALKTGNFRTLDTKSQVAGSATSAPSAITSEVPAAKEAAPEHPPQHTDGKDRRTYKDIPLTPMRKIIASRLTESKQTVPHAYASIDCKLDSVLALRKDLKAKDVKPPSLNDFVIRASALALTDVPEANCTWDSSSQSAIQSKSVDISVAVATPDGLITPIIKAAHHKRLSEISATMKDLAGRARNKQLLPEEFQGGSFTISNLGMFGTSNFCAVINPPQACILAVGGGVQKTVADANTESQLTPEEVPTHTMMTVTLSSDERCVDQACVSKLLAAFRGYLEEPTSML